MRSNLLLFFCVFGMPFLVNAQKITITGRIVDTAARRNLPYASVVILAAQDSVLVNSTRTDFSGDFKATILGPGKYMIMVTYPSFIDFVKVVIADPQQSTIDIGTINLIKETVLLNEVLVKAKVNSIRMRGDTIEFNAKQYHLQPNASVEDLLRRLPGLQVDNYGNITAEGKRINKVLVDGEEFFGDDPTLVTRNLRADMIDKVQVYDRKSEKAKFTGIDDGIKEKTLNLKLKEDKKVGDFGQVVGGLATGGYYQGSLMYNYFNYDEKLALYGLANNIGVTGLSNRDQDVYSPGNDNVNLSDNELDSWNGGYFGQGIPTSVNAGAHYNNKWNGGKENLNTNYSFSHFNISGNDAQITQENLPDSVLYTHSSHNYHNSLMSNSINGDFKIQADSLTEIDFSLKGKLIDKSTFNDYSTTTKLNNNQLLNESDRTFSTTGHDGALDNDVLILKKFKKDRRTIAIDLNEYYGENNSKGTLNSTNYFFQNAVPDTQQVHQYKTINSSTNIFLGKLTYTEPITKSSVLIFDYSLTENQSKSIRNSYDLSPSGSIGALDSLFSNHYKFNQSVQKGGIGYNTQYKKVRFQLASDIADNHFDQKDLLIKTDLQRDFFLFYPMASLTVDISPYSSFTFNYNGNTNIPSVQQLQPVLNNIDPLNVFIGNVNLKPTFTNAFGINFFNYSAAKSTFINISGNYSTNINPISIAVNTDATGKNNIMFVNMNGYENKNFSGDVSYSFPTKIAGIGCNVDAGINGNIYQSLSNGQLNTTESDVSHLTLGLGAGKDKRYNLGIGLEALYAINNSSLQPDIDNNYWSYIVTPNFDFYLPANIQIHTEANYTWQEKTATFTSNFSRVIWNSWISKNITKQNELSVKVTANDILNQNRGFDRSANNNFISQNTYSTIKRFFMLSLIYNFQKFHTSNLK